MRSLQPPLCCLPLLSALIPLALSYPLPPPAPQGLWASSVGQDWTLAQCVGISMELCA